MKRKFLLLLTINLNIFGICDSCFRTQKRKEANDRAQAFGLAIGGFGGLGGAIATAAILKLSPALIAAALLCAPVGGLFLGAILPSGLMLCYYCYKDKNDIFYAIEINDKKNFKYNLKKPDILNIANKNGYTPLELVLLNEQSEFIELIDINKLKLETINKAADTISKFEKKYGISVTSQRLLNTIKEEFYKNLLDQQLNVLPKSLTQMILDYNPLHSD